MFFRSLCYLNNSAICESKVNIVLILAYGLEHGIAVLTVLAIGTILSVLTILAINSIFAVFACGFAELCPSSAIVIRNKPLALLNLQLWSNAVLTILTVLSIFAVSTILTILSVCSSCFAKLCPGSTVVV